MAKVRFTNRFKGTDGKTHRITRWYNTDNALFICNTPHGLLYKKRAGTLEFFLYHPEKAKCQRDMITPDIPWSKANELCRTYGTLEKHRELFSLYGQSTDPRGPKHCHIALDSKYRIKAMRNASFLGMNLTQFVRYLIDKYDNGRSYQ